MPQRLNPAQPNRLMGGRLVVWNEVDAGTEVELRIPGSRRLRNSSEVFLVVAKVGRKGKNMKWQIGHEVIA
jgi:hypothetical protein